MPLLRSFLLLLAGVGGGLTGAIAGLASLVSYPALLAAGLGPVSANVTNTVALMGSSVGSIWGSLPELRGERPALRHLLPIAVAGGGVGGVLLLVSPAHAFALVVPVLIGAASAAMLVPTPTHPSTGSGRSHRRKVRVCVFVIGAYGGYFGAAAGVLLLAVMLVVDRRSLASASAMKNVLLGAANAVAAIAFVFFGPVRWSAAIPLGVGLFIGGRIGPGIVRRAPARPLRIIIAIAGLGLALELALTTYG